MQYLKISFLNPKARIMTMRGYSITSLQLSGTFCEKWTPRLWISLFQGHLGPLVKELNHTVTYCHCLKIDDRPNWLRMEPLHGPCSVSTCSLSQVDFNDFNKCPLWNADTSFYCKSAWLFCISSPSSPSSPFTGLWFEAFRTAWGSEGTLHQGLASSQNLVKSNKPWSIWNENTNKSRVSKCRNHLYILRLLL